MKYLIKIHWSDEDNAYIATVPALRGCISHGRTYKEAVRNIQDAADMWLASAKKHNDPIPEPDLAAEEIQRMAPLLNVSKLARLAGLNKHTLASKLRRRSKFTPDESGRILAAIGHAG